MARLTQDDIDQIEAFRATATHDETVKFAAELYKLRNTPGGNFFAGFPRYVIIPIAVWFGLLETADKLPTLLLSYPRYQAALAEADAKLLQPDLARAQLAKAENDAKASVYQPDLTQAQSQRAENEAEASKLQPAMVMVQLEKGRNDAKASAFQPELTSVQLAKTKLETQAAEYQPKLTAMQLLKLSIDTKVAAANLPAAEQGAALGNATLTFLNPLLMALMGKASEAINTATAPQTSQQEPAPSQDFINGRGWRDKWEGYVASLSGDALQGAQFWASVRSDNRPHTCNEGMGATSQDFRAACLHSQEMLATVDKWRRQSPDFRAGWNSR